MAKKISTGCDIVFAINGDLENTIRMGSTLSSELVSYKAIAEVLKGNLQIKELLRDLLKRETSTREVTGEILELEGIIHNCTVYNIAQKYPELDWSNVDQSTKILSISWFDYYGKDLSGKIIQLTTPGGTKYDIIVVDTSNPVEVERLNSYLRVKDKLTQLEDETRTIVEASDTLPILALLPVVITALEENYKKWSELNEKVKNGLELTKAESKRYIKLANEALQYESFKEFTPNNVYSLLEDYMSNSSKYQGLSYVLEGYSRSINIELNNTLKLIDGKKVKEAVYNDVLANDIVANSKYNRAKKLSYIRLSDFISALKNKQKDLLVKREAMEDKRGDAYKLNVALDKAISHFLELLSKTPKHWIDIINLLIDLADDEFSYSFDHLDKGNIYLKNVPRTLEEKYQDFTYKTVRLLKPARPDRYKGFAIYTSPDGKGYYYSRHVLTTKTYGKKYSSIDDCIKAIDNGIINNAISLLSLIELKTRGDRDVIYTPNRFLPGLVIRSINMQFSSSQKLNETEQELIYNNGLYNSNNLNKFYDYVVGVIDSKFPNNIRKALEKTVDTAEKAVCFIYALNESVGTERTKVSQEVFNDILKRIEKADEEAEYFIVEEVGDYSTSGSNYGFKLYYNTTTDGINKKGTYKTLLTKINPAEIQNNLVETDDTTQRPYPSIRYLNDLKAKLEAKGLGFKIHIETQSSLEELFKEWGEEMPSAVKGFIRNGEVYINSSIATELDVFHEYTHLMLGVLKARNYDNYQELVNIVGNSKKAENMKKSLKERYPNLAEQDLNEEVFAEMFAKHMAGKSFDMFLDGKLRDARKAVDESMGSIFGALKITEEFYNATLPNIFKQFSHDLGLIMNEGNGLELSQGKQFRLASHWIEEQIRKYKDPNNAENVGIYENC